MSFKSSKCTFCRLLFQKKSVLTKQKKKGGPAIGRTNLIRAELDSRFRHDLHNIQSVSYIKDRSAREHSSLSLSVKNLKHTGKQTPNPTSTPKILDSIDQSP